jgi:hypothetical protein
MQSRQEQDSGIRRQFGQSVRRVGSWCRRRSEDGQAGRGSLHSAPGLLQHEVRIALVVVLGCAGIMSVGAESPLQVRLAAGRQPAASVLWVGGCHIITLEPRQPGPRVVRVKITPGWPKRARRRVAHGFPALQLATEQPPEQRRCLWLHYCIHAGGLASEVRGRWRRTVKQRRDHGRRSGGMDGGMGRPRMKIKLARHSAISRSPLGRL